MYDRQTKKGTEILQDRGLIGALPFSASCGERKTAYDGREGV